MSSLLSFIRIADLETPRERMVQVVRWYLSAFHAGRNSEIAKKPYNPILGETFLCFWTIPDDPVGNVSTFVYQWLYTHNSL